MCCAVNGKMSFMCVEGSEYLRPLRLYFLPGKALSPRAHVVGSETRPTPCTTVRCPVVPYRRFREPTYKKNPPAINNPILPLCSPRLTADAFTQAGVRRNLLCPSTSVVDHYCRRGRAGCPTYKRIRPRQRGGVGDQTYTVYDGTLSRRRRWFREPTYTPMSPPIPSPFQSRS